MTETPVTPRIITKGEFYWLWAPGFQSWTIGEATINWQFGSIDESESLPENDENMRFYVFGSELQADPKRYKIGPRIDPPPSL
jgi:hypothetical protein